MSFLHKLQYYHSYNGNDSIMGSYCCDLRDGGELIVLAVVGGINYIIRKDGKQREMMIPIDGWNYSISLCLEKNDIYCIGITGFSIANDETLIFLMRQKLHSSLPGTVCQLIAISFESSSHIQEKDVAFPNSRCRIDFIPTFMKTIIVPSYEASGQNHYVFLGKQDGTAATYYLDYSSSSKSAHPVKSHKLRRTKYFNDFFPRGQSPLLCMDFIEISETRRFWAFGYANGLVCVFSVAAVKFDNKGKLKTFVVEYSPTADNQTVDKNAEKIEKLVLATHLSSPIYCVQLLFPCGTVYNTEKERLRVDFIASSYDNKIVQYTDILKNGLSQTTPFGDLTDVSCVNCLLTNDYKRLYCGDMSNRVIIFDRSEDKKDEFKQIVSIGVNDCVYNVYTMKNGDLIVYTRLGVYIYSFSIFYKHFLNSIKF